MSSYWIVLNCFVASIAKLAALLLVAVIGSSPAVSAEPRNIAGLSSEFLQIAQAGGRRIVVAGLDDIALGTWPGSGDLRGGSQHCVGTNVSGRRFGIVVRGNGAGGAFRLSNGISSLPFRVRYNDGTGRTRIRPGRLVSNLAGQPLGQCRNVNQQRLLIEVRIRDADMQAATPGSYSGSLTLTVTPE